jgi:hypothetical protein
MGSPINILVQTTIPAITDDWNILMGALLSVGLPHWQVDGLIEDYAHYRRGEASSIASGVQDATGSPPRSFDSFARDYASAFC